MCSKMFEKFYNFNFTRLHREIVSEGEPQGRALSAATKNNDLSINGELELAKMAFIWSFNVNQRGA